MLDDGARELARLARGVLFTRKDARIHLPNAKAAIEILGTEAKFWSKVESVMGARLDEDGLASVLIAGGVPADQAPRWSRAIIRGEDDDGIELDPPDNCKHCGSALLSRAECGVCGQPRGSAPNADPTSRAIANTEAYAARVVRALVAAGKLELVSKSAEAIVVRTTVSILLEPEEDHQLAEDLEGAWIDMREVSELFADPDEIVAVLRAERR
ncbi:MAG: hypothetical protein SFX73_04855 [Kofleriaceae bacterium]|nr:hypothetical protein [Kofleriaceae bacterium]